MSDNPVLSSHEFPKDRVISWVILQFSSKQVYKFDFPFSLYKTRYIRLVLDHLRCIRTGNKIVYVPSLGSKGNCEIRNDKSGHSKESAAAANVTAHELMETITNPNGKGWYNNEDTSLCKLDGECENGDKCAWSFPPELSELTNGSKWKLQMEWSNEAFLNGSGLSNLIGQYGCIYK